MAPPTYCAVHNLMGTIQLCDHLLAAVRSHGVKMPNKIIDAVKDYAHIALCEDCLDHFGQEYDTDGIHVKLDEFPSNLVCYACYLEWESGYATVVEPSKYKKLA